MLVGYLNGKKINMSGTKKKSGGAREGGGRKDKYGEPTKVMRVPISLIPALEKKMQKLIKKQSKL